MAKILFFLEELPPSQDLVAHMGFRLIESLAQSQHEILLATSYQPEKIFPEMPRRVQLVQPFEKWSVPELVKFFPLVARFRPDIVHMIQPFSSRSPHWLDGRSTLPILSQVAPDILTAVTYFDCGPWLLRQGLHRQIIRHSRLIFVSNRAQEQLVQSLPEFKTERQMLATVAPDLSVTMGTEHLQLPFEDYIYIPGALHQHDQVEVLLRLLSELIEVEPQTGIIFGQGWGEWPRAQRGQFQQWLHQYNLNANVLVWESPTLTSTESLVARSKLFVGTSLRPTSFSLMFELRLALKYGITPALTSFQARLDPHPWENHVNAVVGELSEMQWVSWVHKALRDQKLNQQDLNERAGFALDQSSNLINRYYAQLL